MSKKVDEFVSKINYGKAKSTSRLIKFQNEIFELRDKHYCSYPQIQEFLLEQKIIISAQAVMNFYKENKDEYYALKRTEEATKEVEQISSKEDSDNAVVADYKKLWEK